MTVSAALSRSHGRPVTYSSRWAQASPSRSVSVTWAPAGRARWVYPPPATVSDHRVPGGGGSRGMQSTTAPACDLAWARAAVVVAVPAPASVVSVMRQKLGSTGFAAIARA
ncbi:hypothetical protein GCM10025734_68280 [Kitasatospora paranensis]